ncbi:flagella synthesis protein FlgN [Natronospira bacteriovora]|uniref:Flagellar protein FlgN n=1 Tax=Natronospira bacteriovora TaxID=3069753 RepID=A0ABU0W3L6_9GAMM|nr:flagellar protein FlgN [Natronospira sp. AB-CW4]MDQ2068498.1 flagellar protein FlgN [Natronospira sp. AB-CW4]
MSGIESTLQQIRDRAAAFEALLEREGETLAKRDTEGMESLVREKLDGANAIEQLHAQLLSEVSTADGKQDPAQSLAAALARNPSADRLWQEAENTLKRVRGLNQKNGHQLMLQQRQTDQALAIIHGGADHSGNATYGSDGKPRSDRVGQRHVEV